METAKSRSRWLTLLFYFLCRCSKRLNRTTTANVAIPHAWSPTRRVDWLKPPRNVCSFTANQFKYISIFACSSTTLEMCSSIALELCSSTTLEMNWCTVSTNSTQFVDRTERMRKDYQNKYFKTHDKNIQNTFQNTIKYIFKPYQKQWTSENVAKSSKSIPLIIPKTSHYHLKSFP